MAELVAFNLEKEGYKSFIASDGMEGLEMVRQYNPDLVLLDLMLPRIHHRIPAAAQPDEGARHGVAPGLPAARGLGIRLRGDTRTVDTHITGLRTKLGAAGKMIRTVRGFGHIDGAALMDEQGPTGGGQHSLRQHPGREGDRHGLARTQRHRHHRSFRVRQVHPAALHQQDARPVPRGQGQRQDIILLDDTDIYDKGVDPVSIRCRVGMVKNRTPSPPWANTFRFANRPPGTEQGWGGAASL